MMDITALKSRARNPRTHSQKQIEQIAASITRFGFINPVLIDEENRIIAGRGHVAGAKRAGLKQVPTLRVMALQIICEIYPYPEISLVGSLPPELNAHIDMVAAVSARSANPDDASAFVRFVAGSEAAPVWKAKGLDPLK